MISFAENQGRPETVALTDSPWDVIIIGAGHNGLVAAAYLGKAGKRVLVLERREQIGGACTIEEPLPGYQVSPCAYLCGLLHPLVIDELELVERGLKWTPADAGLFVPLSNGDFIQLYEDDDACLKEVQRIAPEDLEGFQAMQELFRFCREKLRPVDLSDIWIGDAPSREEICERLEQRQDAVDLMFHWSMGDLLDRYLTNELLKEALYGQGVIGTCATPFEPGTAYVHFHHSSGTMFEQPGTWGFVTGGMGRVSFILGDVAAQAGVTIKSGVTIQRILPGIGVEDEHGVMYRAPTVISNATPVWTLGALGDQADPAWAEQVRSIPTRSCTMKVNLYLNDLPDFICKPGAAEHHRGQVNIPLDRETWMTAFKAAEQGRLPEKLWMELYFQSAVDSTTTPQGKHAVSVFAQPVPFENSDSFNWNRDGHRAIDLVIRGLSRCCSNMPQIVEHAACMGPPHIEEKMGLTGGHIFQGEILPAYMWEHRPAAQTPMRGVYLCGAGTHPGGSVIGINGRNAAMAVLKDIE